MFSFIAQSASLEMGTLPLQRVSWYDTKQSDDETPVMLELWERRSIHLPGPLWPEVVAPDTILSMDQIELFDI